jgi:hypothetical protein
MEKENIPEPIASNLKLVPPVSPVSNAPPMLDDVSVATEISDGDMVFDAASATVDRMARNDKPLPKRGLGYRLKEFLLGSG